MCVRVRSCVCVLAYVDVLACALVSVCVHNIKGEDLSVIALHAGPPSTPQTSINTDYNIYNILSHDISSAVISYTALFMYIYAYDLHYTILFAHRVQLLFNDNTRPAPITRDVSYYGSFFVISITS